MGDGSMSMELDWTKTRLSRLKVKFQNWHNTGTLTVVYKFCFEMSLPNAISPLDVVSSQRTYHLG